ncbi:hypothetical protein TIFTF001_006386 [Ficus carica]|uniref:LsmAD domain-containing protein n=1 Tax=Ficus carica TaxID=3494 RepID=A0AA88DFM3_FICCA|nr:hypothetical protein TIFTF001_006386 [Ficus carica]
MNTQHTVHSRPSANGFGRRRVEREVGTRMENKSQSGKSNSTSRITNNTGEVKNGSIYSGIFHAANAEKDFGIILKMARMTKDGSSRGQKSVAESVSKAPSKTFIIPAKELVQVIAKDVSITRDGFSDEVQQHEIMIDSFISQSRRVEVERELEPWVPDEDDPQCPDLENIFDKHRNRGWNQFEANEALFGVKSTFNEELYTTKLEKGPLTRDLEKEALRLAREIENEETYDLHLAEERGLHLGENFDIDEEARFSSVYRGKLADDSSYEEEEDVTLDSCNNETFGDSSTSAGNTSIDRTKGKNNDVTQVSSSSSAMDQAQPSQSNVGVDLSRSGSYDHARQLASESHFKGSSTTGSESRIQDNQLGEQGPINSANESTEKQTLVEDTQRSNSDGDDSSSGKKNGSDKGGLSPNATSYAPSHASLKGNENTNSPGELVEGPVSAKAHAQTQATNPHGRPGSSASSSSERAVVASASGGPGLSPSSSVGSLSSLNSHAKEFKLNPNAKSFTPSQSPVRPPSPVADGSYYFQHSMTAVPQIPGMPVSIGIAPSFGQQPVIFNPQGGPLQTPQTYFHPNGPQGTLISFIYPRAVWATDASESPQTSLVHAGLPA